jgi:hypothetical protein
MASAFAMSFCSSAVIDWLLVINNNGAGSTIIKNFFVSILPHSYMGKPRTFIRTTFLIRKTNILPSSRYFKKPIFNVFFIAIIHGVQF